jgi:diguanylate cyclase (GGDEF)-like protein
MIFREGDAGKEMYIFISGLMKAYAKQSDGNQRWLFDIKQPGEFFGEMSIIAHEPRSAAIGAAEDSVAMKLKEDDFFGIISRYPMIGSRILRAIGTVQNQWLDQASKSYNDLIRWGENARRRAITDEMTGLYNRSFLEESIKERFSNKSMGLRVMSLLMIDLDRIHYINNNHGPIAGDLVIIAAAGAIRPCLRSGDIPARLSGDEFAILLPDTDTANAGIVAERIREKIEKQQVKIPASPAAGETILITTCVSIGIATAPAHAGTMEKLIETSDAALRKAKELGRNRVEVYD